MGFQLNDGIDGSGFAQLAWIKAGGYYLGERLRQKSRLTTDGSPSKMLGHLDLSRIRK
jgi:hypothetical protein